MDNDLMVLAIQQLGQEIAALRSDLKDRQERHYAGDDILTAKEVARDFKVSYRAVLQWTDTRLHGEDALPYYGMGKSWTFKRSDVEQFIERFKTNRRNVVRFSTRRSASKHSIRISA